MTTSTIQAALDNLVATIRAELREEFLSVLGDGGGVKRRPPAKATKGRRVTKARAGGAKRTPDELESLTKSILAYIKKNPGQRVEQIAAGMGASTKELALPIRKLGKALKTRGQRRGMTYAVR